jgi:chromosome partitioning protein
VISLHGSVIRTQVQQLRAKYEQIIIDVGGRDTASLRAALTVADILVVPVFPATFDIWSLEQLEELIHEAWEINHGLSVIAVLNAADWQGKDNEEAGTIIREAALNTSSIQSCGAKRSETPRLPGSQC